MKDIICFLKFGELKHIEELAKGELYFSNALQYRRIENELLLKGQGDKLEGGSLFHGYNMTMIDNETNEIRFTGVKGSATVFYQGTDLMPVFCLFACYDKDCTIQDDGTIKFHFSEEIQNSIKEHFPKADSVAIIRNTESFVDCVNNSLKTDVKSEIVHYFHIYGFESEKGKAIDMEYYRYLTQDVPPVVSNGGEMYTFCADYVYRALLCKDVYYINEQEYRFLLPNKEIKEGTIFKIELDEKVQVQSLDSFWKEMNQS